MRLPPCTELLLLLKPRAARAEKDVKPKARFLFCFLADIYSILCSQLHFFLQYFAYQAHQNFTIHSRKVSLENHLEPARRCGTGKWCEISLIFKTDIDKQ